MSLLLGGCGYSIRVLETYPSGVVDELLDGVDALLLAPGFDDGMREAFVGAMGKSTLHRASMPVIVLCTATDKAPLEKGVISVPWPCETKVLVERIEAALSGESPEGTVAV